MTDKKDEDVLDSLDSWEDLLEENQEAAFEKLNAAFEKVQINGKNKKVVDPFGGGSSSKANGVDKSELDGFHHLAVLSGAKIDEQDVLYKLKKNFGKTVRLKQIDDSNYIICFSSVMDARHAIKAQQLFAPQRIYAIDDPDFKNVDFLFENRAELKPTTTDIRPATNMSMIRNTVSRHLNVALPKTAQHLEEKEQLKRAKEAKKAKAELWKE